MSKNKEAGLRVPTEGIDDMHLRPGQRLLSLLLPAALMLAAAPAAAQEEHDHAAAPVGAPAAQLKRVLWSDPAAWPDGKVPAEGAAVTIARDLEVVLDVAPPALRSLTVD